MITHEKQESCPSLPVREDLPAPLQVFFQYFPFIKVGIRCSLFRIRTGGTSYQEKIIQQQHFLLNPHNSKGAFVLKAPFS